MIKGKHRLPLGGTVVALFLALATVGMAYGLWSKTLTIEGSVQTGTVHAKWTGAGCFEFFDWPWPPEGDGEVDGKDIGSTTAVVDPADENNLIITVENAYPSYASDCEVEYTNDGSVPWTIRGISIVPVSTNLTNCTVSGTSPVTLSCDQLTVVFVDGVGAQIDPGKDVASSFRLHVEQPAEMNATYQFEVQVCVAQWNEAGSCP